MSTKVEATIEDLYNVPDNGKAEIVDGELVLMSPTGDLPSTAASEVFVSLREQSRRTGYGRAYSDNVGFIVNLPNVGALVDGRRFEVFAKAEALTRAIVVVLNAEQLRTQLLERLPAFGF